MPQIVSGVLTVAALSCAAVVNAVIPAKMAVDEMMHVYDACMDDEAIKNLAAKTGNELCRDATKLLTIEIADAASKYITGYGLPGKVKTAYFTAFVAKVKSMGMEEVNMLQQCVVFHYAKHYAELKGLVEQLGSEKLPDWAKDTGKDAKKLKEELEKLMTKVDAYANLVGYSFAKQVNPTKAATQAAVNKYTLPDGLKPLPNPPELGMIDRGCQKMCNLLYETAKTMSEPAIKLFRDFTKYLLAKKVMPEEKLPNVAAIKQLAEDKCVSYTGGAATTKVAMTTALKGYAESVQKRKVPIVGLDPAFNQMPSPVEILSGGKAAKGGSVASDQACLEDVD